MTWYLRDPNAPKNFFFLRERIETPKPDNPADLLYKHQLANSLELPPVRGLWGIPDRTPIEYTRTFSEVCLHAIVRTRIMDAYTKMYVQSRAHGIAGLITDWIFG